VGQIDIYAHTAYNYFKALNALNISMGQVRIIVSSPESLMAASDPEPRFALLNLRESIRAWLMFRDERKVEDLQIRMLDAVPSRHFLVADRSRGNVGVLSPQDGQALRILDNYVFSLSDMEILRDLSFQFSQNFDKAKEFPADWIALRSIEEGRKGIKQGTYKTAFLAHRNIPSAALKQWTRQIKSLANRMGLPTVSLLDIGCGTGRFTLPFAEVLKESTRMSAGGNCDLKVVGLDEDEGMLAEAVAQARRRGLDNVTFVCEPFGQSSDPESCDIAFISEVLQVVECRVRFFSHLSRVVRNNGFAVFRFPSHADLNDLEMLTTFGVLQAEKERTLDVDELLNLLAFHGFAFRYQERIDESKDYAKDDYYEMLAQKPFSILRILPDAEFASRLELEREKDLRDRIPHRSVMTMMVFQKVDSGSIFLPGAEWSTLL
jgi:SAM-dependent methyltransferase